MNCSRNASRRSYPDGTDAEISRIRDTRFLNVGQDVEATVELERMFQGRLRNSEPSRGKREQICSRMYSNLPLSTAITVNQILK